MTFPTRVAVRASEIRFATVLLSILSAPFYVLGFLAGVVVVVVSWALASAAIAYGDVRDRHRPGPVVNADDGAR